MDFRDFLRNNIDLIVAVLAVVIPLFAYYLYNLSITKKPEQKSTGVNQHNLDVEALIQYTHILEQKIDELEKNVKENTND